MSNVYKYCCNGEVGYTRADNLFAAQMALMNKYLKKYGVFNLTDIKPVPKPQRERYGNHSGKNEAACKGGNSKSTIRLC